MKIFGLPVPFTGERKAATLSSVNDNRGWHKIFEANTGNWQRNIVVKRDSVLAYHAVYACMTLIASDIAKLRVKLVQEHSSGVWEEVSNPAYTPVLRKPNHYQTRIQFYENWVLSKLMRGNTYVLKERDNRGVVTALYVLDPNLVTVMVTDDGEVFYQLAADNLPNVQEDILVPASEIIHDRFNCLFHPLVGTSPIFANGVAAMQGVHIQNNSATFFGNKSQPGGILTAPGNISDETAARLKAYWETEFSGKNAGKVAVVGDGLQYQQLMISAHESQLIEQLRWTAEVICSTFHVPPYKIGVGQLPSYNNVQALNVEYYSQCLQRHIEDIEICLDEGLSLMQPGKSSMGVEFDLDNLLRMDAVTQMDVLEKSKGKLTVNEQRLRLNVKPVAGGDTVYLQEQDHSLEALAKRDAGPDPFGRGAPEHAEAAEEEPETDLDDEANEDVERAWASA
ncbi:HK97 family phage portal protein [Aquamicrobium lusatiense]|uniref:HK97 family phage portal protein n=1 Tax=Aquamicrobium lusatiense TaxID=89772 RepID=A0A7W9S3M2_9HYPH|nr:phage portal protein [Aquamicrobium lusatiense]MBB6013496.1 HK97 family phage portal protein [Aquamicrobium lusatiense]